MTLIGLDRNIVSNDEIDTFMQSPLITWVQGLPGLGTSKLESMSDLIEGVFLMDVASSMDYAFFATYLDEIDDENLDSTDVQLKNNKVLVQALTSYYQEKLNVVVLFELPVIASISRKPLRAVGLSSIRHFLLLLLGVSLRCENNKKYMEYITTLDRDEQISIVKQGQVIVKGLFEAYVGSMQTLSREDLEMNFEQTLIKFKEVLTQRYDMEASVDAVLAQAEDEARIQAENHDTAQVSSRRLRDLDQQVQLLTEGLDHRTSQYNELNEELKQSRCETLELRERVRLLARFEEEAKGLYDEMDTWKHRASEYEITSREFEKAKEKLVDQVYLNKRIQELEERNELLTLMKEKESLSSSAHQEHRQLLASKESDIRYWTASTNELLQAQAKWLNEKKNMTTQALKSESIITEQQQKIAILQSQLNHTQQQGDTVVSKHEEELRLLRSTIETLKLESVQQDDRKEEVDYLKLELASFEKLHNELHAELRSQLTHLQQANFKNSDLEKEVESLRRRITDLTEINKGIEVAQPSSGRHSRLDDNNDDIVLQLEEAFQKAIKLKDERIAVLMQRLEDITKQNEKLHQDLTNSKMRAEALEVDIRNTNSPLSKRKSIGERPDTAQVVREAAESKEKGKSDAALAHVTKKYSKLKVKLKSQEREVTRLRGEELRLIGKLRDVKREKKMLEVENGKLNKHVESMLTQNRELLFKTQQTEKILQSHTPKGHRKQNKLEALEHDLNNSDPSISVQHMLLQQQPQLLRNDRIFASYDPVQQQHGVSDTRNTSIGNDQEAKDSSSDVAESGNLKEKLKSKKEKDGVDTSDEGKRKKSLLKNFFLRKKNKDTTSPEKRTRRAQTISGARHFRSHSNDGLLRKTTASPQEGSKTPQFMNSGSDGLNSSPVSIKLNTNLVMSSPRPSQRRRPISELDLFASESPARTPEPMHQQTGSLRTSASAVDPFSSMTSPQRKASNVSIGSATFDDDCTTLQGRVHGFSMDSNSNEDNITRIALALGSVEIPSQYHEHQKTSSHQAQKNNRRDTAKNGSQSPALILTPTQRKKSISSSLTGSPRSSFSRDGTALDEFVGRNNSPRESPARTQQTATEINLPRRGLKILPTANYPRKESESDEWYEIGDI
eukprot:m.103914 g.103914  ORF g.103914 m.103914 type:complete len:1128 (+) comp9103_c0_seq7:157-3540(+)